MRQESFIFVEKNIVPVPSEIILYLFSFLDTTSIYKLRLVCKVWKRASDCLGSAAFLNYYQQAIQAQEGEEAKIQFRLPQHIAVGYYPIAGMNEVKKMLVNPLLPLLKAPIYAAGGVSSLIVGAATFSPIALLYSIIFLSLSVKEAVVGLGHVLLSAGKCTIYAGSLAVDCSMYTTKIAVVSASTMYSKYLASANRNSLLNKQECLQEQFLQAQMELQQQQHVVESLFIESGKRVQIPFFEFKIKVTGEDSSQSGYVNRVSGVAYELSVQRTELLMETQTTTSTQMKSPEVVRYSLKKTYSQIKQLYDSLKEIDPEMNSQVKFPEPSMAFFPSSVQALIQDRIAAFQLFFDYATQRFSNTAFMVSFLLEGK